MALDIVSHKNAEKYWAVLPDAFFREPPRLGIVCIEETKQMPVGFTLVKMEEEWLLIEHISVQEEYRRRGAGSRMLRGVCEMARAAGLDRIEIYFDRRREELPQAFLFANDFLISEEGRPSEGDASPGSPGAVLHGLRILSGGMIAMGPDKNREGSHHEFIV